MEKVDIARIHWSDLWSAIYHYAGLHRSFPENFPLPKNFWVGGNRGYPQRREDHRDAQEELMRLLEVGPFPTLSRIQSYLGYGAGDTHQFLRRRYRYVLEEIEAFLPRIKEVSQKPSKRKATDGRPPCQ